MRQDIRDTIAALPASPGVYLMKDRQGEVFYVGKAKSLRDRVKSYFSGSDTRAFVAQLEEVLADLEVVLTHTDKEALLLENDLIKRYRPRFNVKLTDDKNFLCLKLNLRQTYPRLQIVRGFAKDGSKYFGPYHSATAIRETLRLINRHFQLRTCSDHVLTHRQRPCLQYQIKRCPAPCVFDLSNGEYAQNVANVAAFLEGRQDELLTSLRQRMHEKAAAQQFEAAAVVRDQLRAVQSSLERQRVVTSDFADRDVIGMYREGPEVEVHVMRTRHGRLIEARRFSFSEMDLPDAEVLSQFVSRYYGHAGSAGAALGEAAAATEDRSGVAADIPEEIVLPAAMEWADALGSMLSERRGQKVRLCAPQRGHKRRLVQLAMRNAHQAFLDKKRQAGAARTAIERLQRALHLRKAPERIECFDISHLQGDQIVASVVRFEHGIAQKERYRHYKIASTGGQDDFQSMYEVVGRRVRRGLEEGDLPDLLVIDGGKGQLNAARAALSDHGVEHLDIVGLAKSRVLASAFASGSGSASAFASASTSAQHADADAPTPRSPERVFVLGQKNPVVLRQDSAELFLLVRARDEAHRFAIAFHRKLRRKAISRSALDAIPGVGPKRRRALLKAFGSVARLRSASFEAIQAVVGPAVAQRVMEYLAPEPKKTNS